MNDPASLEKKMNIAFGDRSLLEQALVHSSYLNENASPALSSNERLEFLGDAVIGLAVARELYAAYPSLSEGQMSRVRAAVISRQVLARRARALGIGDHLLLAKGEEQSGGREKESNLAGAFEAVLGAILVDQGFEIASQVAVGLLGEEMEAAVEGREGFDCKSQLQEFLQKEYKQTPTYRITGIEGPEHARRFTAEVVVGQDSLGLGTGTSKQRAEREAARAALARLGLTGEKAD